MPPAKPELELGLGRGKVFPADKARSLLNPARRLVQSPRRTVGAIGLHAGARVLELGCGPGFFSPHLVQASGDGHVVLLDLQREIASDRCDAVGPHWTYSDTNGCCTREELMAGNSWRVQEPKRSLSARRVEGARRPASADT